MGGKVSANATKVYMTEAEMCMKRGKKMSVEYMGMERRMVERQDAK